MADLLKSATFEHQFWLRIMGDHALFIRDSLYPEETDDIHKSNQLLTAFQQLLEQANSLSSRNVIAYTKQAESALEEIKAFKLSILKGKLIGDIDIHLSPTIMNHFINEIEEYENVIADLKEGIASSVNNELPIHHTWISDTAGHARMIMEQLDKVESHLKHKSYTFSKHFDQFYLKVVELTGYLRSEISSFPALQQFNTDVQTELRLFLHFLLELAELKSSEKILGTISNITIDHMYREGCYYLHKLADATNSPTPSCDPTKSKFKF